MRRHILVLVMLLLVAAIAPTLAADKVLGTGTVKGTFVGVETGDYQHFLMKDAAGKERSFFVRSKPSKTVAAMLESPAKYKGKKVTVKWEKVETVIPEAGGPQTIERVVDVVLK